MQDDYNDPWSAHVFDYERVFPQRVIVELTGDETGTPHGVRLSIGGPGGMLDRASIKLTPDEANELASRIAEVAFNVATAPALDPDDGPRF